MIGACPHVDVASVFAVATPDDGSSWGLIAAIVTAVAALVTLLLREFQRRREDLDQKVSNAVSAGLGRTLVEFRQMEEGAKETLNTVLANAERIENALRERLAVSEQQAERLSELLTQASDVVPRLADAQTSVPSLLLQHAETAEPATAVGSLIALLKSEFASSDVLTDGGNVAARRQLGPALALELYDRALALNPNDADAMASGIRIRTTVGQLSIEQGIAQITEVVERNPLDRHAASEALNLFIDFDAYGDMLRFVDRQLEAGTGNTALLWRNRGIALRALQRPPDEIIDAFRRGFDLATESGDEGEISNMARPYAGFLRRTGKLDDARVVVQAALKGSPRDAQLLCVLGDLESDAGRFDSAVLCYELAVECADSPAEAQFAHRHLTNQKVRQVLVERGVLATISAPSTAEPDVSSRDGHDPAEVQ